MVADTNRSLFRKNQNLYDIFCTHTNGKNMQTSETTNEIERFRTTKENICFGHKCVALYSNAFLVLVDILYPIVVIEELIDLKDLNDLGRNAVVFQGWLIPFVKRGLCGRGSSATRRIVACSVASGRDAIGRT